MATMTTPTTTRTSPGIKWTPRQKQVLDLLVKRRTNGQIGEELGISLDGAKWHVSEIIGILGVDTREEAAEYWREYNGLPARFRRVAAGLFGTAGLRWAAAAGGVAALVVAGMVYAALQQAGGEEAPATPAATTTVDTGSLPATPATGGGGAATPGTTGETIAGVPVKELTIGDPLQFPANVVAYYGALKPQSDGSPASLYRAYRNASGELRIDNLFASLSPGPGGIYTWGADYARGEIVAGWCVSGQCGGYGRASGNPENRVFRSTDGGVTWADWGSLPFDGYINGVLPEGVLLSVWVSDTEAKYVLYPSGEELRAPLPGKWYPRVIGGIGLAWENEANEVVDAEGNRLWVRPAGVAVPSQLVEQTPATTSLVTWTKTEGDTTPQTYVGIADAGGTLQDVYSFEGDAQFWASSAVSPTALIGGVHVVLPTSGDRSYPIEVALIDFATGKIHPLPELSADIEPAGYSPFTYDATAGPFVRVANAGDCLNVREQPEMSSTVLTCYRDGVLLRDRGEAREAGSVTWLAVATPDGRDGWASAEFLEK